MRHAARELETRNTTAMETITVSTVVLLFALFPLLSGTWVFGIGVATMVLSFISWQRDWTTSFPIAVFCSVCLLLVLAGLPFSQIWLGIGIVVYIAICRRSKRLTGNLSWLRIGQFDKKLLLLSVSFALLAAIALIAWFYAVQPNIDDLVEKFLPDWHMGYIVVGAIVFSMINAAVEEGAYRGVLMSALDTTIGSGYLAIAIQAIAFGTLHINGFPRGWSGVVLAGLFGVCMGIIRRKSNGMFAPWVTHVCVDMVILSIVAAFTLAA